MSSNNLEVVITARDEASAKLKGIVDMSQKIGVGFGVAGGLIEAALYKTVEAAAGAQEAMSQFDNTMKNTGKDSPAVRDALLKAADATLKLGFDNEDAATSLAKFYSRTKDVTESQKLNVVAMDLARSKHIDLASATNLVNQVLSGNGKVLKQYGIDIKDTATPLEALNQLHEVTKGSAEAFAQTLQGQQAQMQQSIGELMENIGAKLIPLLTDLAQKAIVVIDKIKVWTDAHPDLTKNIVLVVAAVGGLMLVLSPLLIALPAIIAFFGLLSPTVLIVAGIIAGLILIVRNVIEIFDLFRNHSKEVWDGVKITFKEAIDSIVGFFSPLMTILDNVYSKAQKVISAVSRATSGAVSAVGSGLSTAYNAVASVVTGGRASGGSVSAGNSYVVGENGQEVFTPNVAGYVSSNNRGGGITVNINGGTYLSHDVANEIGNMIVQNLRRVARV